MRFSHRSALPNCLFESIRLNCIQKTHRRRCFFWCDASFLLLSLACLGKPVSKVRTDCRLRCIVLGLVGYWYNYHRTII